MSCEQCYDDDDDEGSADSYDGDGSVTCFRCDRATAGEQCCACGRDLCPMCFETSGGYCCTGGA